MQGFKPASNNSSNILALIKYAFPNAVFPVGAIHEFVCNNDEGSSASTGFISGIVSSLMKKSGASLWITSSFQVFPPALKQFGIQPDNIIFIHIKKEKEILWCMEEALKSGALSAVVAEIQNVTLIASRRLQLAVENSGTTGFLLRKNPKSLITSCVTRWKITSLPSNCDTPGVGFPRWSVELQKVRNGKPGAWQMEWRAGKFRFAYKPSSEAEDQQRKAG